MLTKLHLIKCSASIYGNWYMVVLIVIIIIIVQDNITAAMETEEDIANAMLDVTNENDISIEKVKKAVAHMQYNK